MSYKNEELYNLMISRGYPERFAELISRELRTEFTGNRMIGYIKAREGISDGPLPLEEVADEMMSILSDRDRIVNKHIAEDAQNAVNMWYWWSAQNQDDESEQ